jgi:hypothetical protein
MVPHGELVAELSSQGLDVGDIEAQLRNIARSLVVAGGYQARPILT